MIYKKFEVCESVLTEGDGDGGAANKLHSKDIKDEQT